jgi:molybdate transport system ATP-binding protein
VTLAVSVDLKRGDFRLQADCAFPADGTSALFGRSGSGKTTLLRCIAGLERVPGARLHFQGETWQDAGRFVPAHRRRLAYVFQESSLFPHLDVRRNLEYGLRRVPPAQRRLTFDDAVALMGLADLIDHRSEQLSGGQRRRAAIARALLSSPRLLLMDEPLSSLDLESRAELLPHLERLRDELSMPILYVSHEIGEVMRLADHLTLLESGRVRAQGALHELLARPDLPLAHLEEAGSVFEGVITGHDEQYHLSQVDIHGGRVALARRPVPIGQRVRVRIDARDVSLALKPPESSSITNILPGPVVDVSPDRDPAQCLVRIAIGERWLLARVTRRSVDRLAIRPGSRVYAQIKSVALMR